MSSPDALWIDFYCMLNFITVRVREKHIKSGCGMLNIKQVIFIQSFIHEGVSI